MAVEIALVAALTAALAGGLTACRHAGSAKLEGRWKGTRADGVAAGVQDASNAFATQTEIVAKGATISINAPGAPRSQASPYVVDDESKTLLVLHTERDGAANKETFAFAEDGKTMTWKLGDGRSIVFAKQKD
ncbi:MAG: hypothetical protein JWP97_951 [Labilithrix sp.]|nr:hypothetical protein [Labilithrix sp.]